MSRAIAGILVATILCACAKQPELPAPKGAPLLFAAKVEGVQVYRCEGVDPDVWTYKRTEAKLIDEQARQIGTHSHRPDRFIASIPPPANWILQDGSSVDGDRIAQSSSRKANAVPWRLWAVEAHRGVGLLSNVESVRQIETKGGLPPSVVCSSMGSEIRVPFVARHEFYGSEEPE